MKSPFPPLEMAMTFSSHLSASIYPGKWSLRVLQASFSVLVLLVYTKFTLENCEYPLSNRKTTYEQYIVLSCRNRWKPSYTFHNEKQLCQFSYFFNAPCSFDSQKTDIQLKKNKKAALKYRKHKYWNLIALMHSGEIDVGLQATTAKNNQCFFLNVFLNTYIQ